MEPHTPSHSRDKVARLAKVISDHREKYVDPMATARMRLPNTAETLSWQVDTSPSGYDAPTGSRIHARDLKLGVNTGFLRLQRVLEPIRSASLEVDLVYGFCCTDCSDPFTQLMCISSDAIFTPLQISERFAPGREIIISNPVFVTAEHDGASVNMVEITNPTTLAFPAVRPRCFSIGCESAGPMLKCGGCVCTTYCSKVIPST